MEYFDSVPTSALSPFRSGLVRRQDLAGNAWRGTAANTLLMREAGLVNDTVRVAVFGEMPLGCELTELGRRLASQMLS